MKIQDEIQWDSGQNLRVWVSRLGINPELLSQWDPTGNFLIFSLGYTSFKLHCILPLSIVITIASNADPDEIPCSVESHLGLHCPCISLWLSRQERVNTIALGVARANSECRSTY